MTFDCRNCVDPFAYRYKKIAQAKYTITASIPKEHTKSSPLRFAFATADRAWLFHVVVFRMTNKKCTNIENVRAEPIFLLTLKTFLWRPSGWPRRRDLLKLYITAIDTEFRCECLAQRPSALNRARQCGHQDKRKKKHTLIDKEPPDNYVTLGDL